MGLLHTRMRAPDLQHFSTAHIGTMQCYRRAGPHSAARTRYCRHVGKQVVWQALHCPCLLQGTLSQSSSDYHATRSLGAVARKAQELLKRQRQIDQDVSRQWGDTRAAGASWAGQVQLSRRTQATSAAVQLLMSHVYMSGPCLGASSLQVSHRRCAEC